MQVFIGIDAGIQADEIIYNIFNWDGQKKIDYVDAIPLIVDSILLSVTPGSKSNVDKNYETFLSTFNKISMLMPSNLSTYHTISQFINRGIWMAIKDVYGVGGMVLLLKGTVFKKAEYNIDIRNNVSTFDVKGRYGSSEIYIVDNHGSIKSVDKGVSDNYFKEFRAKRREDTIKMKTEKDSKKNLVSSDGQSSLKTE